MKQSSTDDRGVSPVVGVALLIAVTVILAAVIGAVVLGLTTSEAEAPQASLNFENSTSSVTISHEGGEALNGENVEIRGNFTFNFGDGDELAAGESLEKTSISPSEGDEVNVVWVDPNSDDEVVIGSYEV